MKRCFLELIVLGSAAGGGLPQLIVPAVKARRLWDHSRPAQTQASVAVGNRDSGYIVINASPDLRQQILQTPQLQPTRDHPDGVRNSPIKGVIVANADVDNVAGLLNLREKQKFDIYGPTKVLEILADNTIFSVLDPDYVTQRSLETGEAIQPIPGLEIELFTVAGKAPLYLEDSLGIESGDLGFTSGVEVRTEHSKTLVISSCAAIDQKLLERIETAEHLLFDGTVFEDNEMQLLGLEIRPANGWAIYQSQAPTGRWSSSPIVLSKLNASSISITRTRSGTTNQRRIKQYKPLAGIFVTTEWFSRYDYQTSTR